ELRNAATVATDVYALGVMLFEMLTNYNPFLGSWRNDRARLGVTRTSAHVGVTRTSAQSGAVPRAPNRAPMDRYPVATAQAARFGSAEAHVTAPTEVVQLNEPIAQPSSEDSPPSSWSVSLRTAQPRGVQEV